MTPILFRAEERDFTSNGLGRLSEVLSCTVTEERNGIYECEFDYPISGEWYKWLVSNGGCIGVIHDDKRDIQPFDVYSYSAPINGVVTFYAHHISYRLNKVLLEPFSVSSITSLMANIPTHSVTNNPFSFWTDKTTAGIYTLGHPENCRAILGGNEGSILDVYGTGEYEFDKFNVKLHLHRGTDSGVTIRYGKNLVDIVKEFDKSGTYNGIAPYWDDGEGTVVLLPEIFVMASGATADEFAPWTTQNGDEMTDSNEEVIEFRYMSPSVLPMDFTEDFDSPPTAAQLRAAAVAYLSRNEPWIPKENITVDFVQLWQTPEYENVAALQRLSLCDTVSVFYPELGVIAEDQEVIKVTYNVLTEKFDSMELGKAKVSLAETIETAVYAKMEKQTTEITNVFKAAIDNATELITGGLGGHVVFNMNANGEPQEILIMDTDDIGTAVNVIRMNRNGIGFSRSGYEGPYSTAWTIDGSFNANYITAGTLNANLIRAGVLSDYAGKNSWDMISGNMTISGQFQLKKIYSTFTLMIELGQIAAWFYERSSSTGTTLEVVADYGLEVSKGSEYAALTVDRLVNFRKASSLPSDFKIFSMQNGYRIGNRYLYTGLLDINKGLHFRAGLWDDQAEEEIIGSDYTPIEEYAVIDFTENAKVNIDGTLDVSGSANVTGTLNTSGTLNASGNLNLGGTITTERSHFGLSNTLLLARNSDQTFRLQVNSNGFIIGRKSDDNMTGLMAVSYENDSFAIYANRMSLRSVSLTSLYYCAYKVSLETSSSKRYKHDIEALTDKELDCHKLLSLPVRQFRYNEDARNPYTDVKDKLIPGFIAEEVDEVYPIAVIHDDDGKIESWDVKRIVPGMLALIQEQQTRIDALEARLEKLERLVSKLDN